MAAKLKVGVEWPAFEAKVHGWAMDKPVIVVRVHGVSPESSKKEIVGVMSQYGEVLDVEIGFISRKLLPGVTNGTWTVKMILFEHKVLPSFVFMKEEGEVWQVTHENQTNVCWKCGQRGHVGARCNQPTLTFDALVADQEGSAGSGNGTGGIRSWAHVVKTGGCQTGTGSGDISELDRQERILKEKEVLASTTNADIEQVSGSNEADAETVKTLQTVGAVGFAKAVESAKALEIALAAKSDEATEADAAMSKEAEAAVDAVEPMRTEFVSDLDENINIKIAKKKSMPGKQISKKTKHSDEDQFSDELGSGFDSSEKEVLELDPGVEVSEPVLSNIDYTGPGSQATSMAGLASASQETFGLNSQATSKAGLTPASDSGQEEIFESVQNLKVIVPENFTSDSSSDSSPGGLEGDDTQLREENSGDLPLNERSVNNRDLRAFLATKK